MFILSPCLIQLLIGINAQKDPQKDLLRAEQVEKFEEENVIEGRIESNDVGFYKTVNKKKFQTFTGDRKGCCKRQRGCGLG